MTYTADQLSALQDAIAQGVLEVKYADKTVVYRSLSDMMRIAGIIERSLSGGTSSRKLAVFNKGLGSSQNASVE